MSLKKSMCEIKTSKFVRKNFQILKYLALDKVASIINLNADAIFQDIYTVIVT